MTDPLVDTLPVNLHRNEYVSVSRLKTFQTCPKQFWFRYVKRDKGDDGDDTAARFGTVMHAALEDVFAWVMREEFAGIIPEELLIDAFRKHWTESGLTDTGYYNEGISLCRSYLGRNPSIDHFDLLAVEQEFTIEYEGVRFFGFIDRAERGEDDEVIVTDYKTNRMLYEREDLATDIQASIYIYVAKQLWPWASKVSFGFEMLRHATRQRTERTSEELEAAMMFAVDTAKQTERAAQTWPAKVNTLCPWCNNRKSCDAYKGALADELELVMVSPEDLLKLSQQRELIASYMKPMKARKDEIDRLLKARLPDDTGELRLGDYNYRMIHIFKREYPVAETSELLERYGATPEEIASVIETNKKRVEDLAETLAKRMDAAGDESRRRMFQMELKATGNESFNFSRFDSRPMKQLPVAKELARLKGKEDKAPPPEFSPDLLCSFCDQAPAKQVERSGSTFNVCKEHTRKRKPPAPKPEAKT